MAERIKLTAGRVAALPVDTKDYAVWEEGTPGFGVRVYPTGKRRFVVPVSRRRKPQRPCSHGHHR